ncbi:flagellar hook-basal body protein [Dethiosulfovibrio salsuginis]|uniref:Flagellar basal-body rod protein FlgG n=1 Tax=Dethiosulfovibrio salsuginis TaxID=561720 RepID=A0A1X7IUN8_9BACT|nr:flagellar hook-basal body protein [Dethiosulfovibrio salsuginis]SMG18831.1 flagellar basal-body rod protein FlgG [Dethiosulfovibrio salsuginis]
MHKGIYAGVSAMMVQQTTLDATANNLANVDTAGFRARKAVAKSFPEVLMERIDPAKSQGEIPPWPWRSRPIGVASMNQVLSETYMSTEAGNMQVTDSQMDLALEDVSSFFVVMDGEGNQFYTRAGHFIVNQDGQIVTPDGHLLVGEGGPIEVGEVATVGFSDDGQVIADGEAVGQIQLVQFETPTYLRQVGKNLLVETEESGGPIPQENPQVTVGILERSNVSVVEEMVRMIEAQRSYEAASKGVQTSDDMTGRLITSLGKV